MGEQKRLGWDDITETYEKLYPGKTDPLHFAPIVKWSLGGKDPLDGISVYDGGEYYHLVTYGLSELYEKEFEDQPEYSGAGFEMTLKLKKTPAVDEKELRNIAGVLQSIARYIYDADARFKPYEYMYTGQEKGIDASSTSKITGFITVPDEAGEIMTVNGKLIFVQFVGVTDKELQSLINKQYRVSELADKLGTTLTDYSREDVA